MSPFNVRNLSARQMALLYASGVAGAIVLFMAVSWLGERTLEPRETIPVTAAPTGVDMMLHVLLALAVVIVTARLLGAVFTFIHQPAVIGEVVGGIMLGPSLLGAISPDTYAFLLPVAAAPFIGVIAQLGVVLYMFVVGLHLDLSVLRTSGRAALLISHASIVVPFVLGAMLAFVLYTDLAGTNIAFTPFALFLGVAMSVTAFPVLARILGDKGLQKSALGMLGLTCAAIDDVTAWCLLALVVSVSQAALAGAVATVGLTVGYIALMFLVIRPLIARALPFVDKVERLNQGSLAVVFVTLLLSALATEFIGIHAIFGAFLFGAVIPHTSRVAGQVTERMEDVVRVMFLPAFFAFTGMRTEIGLLSTWDDWLLCGVIIAVATLGKFGGAFLAGIASGLGRSESAALGILMNTRGLVELIVLNIGLDIGAISPRLFTMLVVMALVTTVMTSPLLDLIMRGRTWAMIPAATN